MTKLYVGGLPGDVSSDVIRDLLRDRGLPESDGILIKRGGYAFLDFNDEEDAKRVIERLNGHKLSSDHTLVVEPSTGSEKKSLNERSIKLGKLPSGCSEQQIRDLVVAFGALTSVTFEKNGEVNGKNGEEDEDSATMRNCVVTFAEKEQAEVAMKGLEDKNLNGQKFTVSPCEGPSRNGPKRPNVNNGRNGSHNPQRIIDFPLRILVQSEMVGAIIGRSGQTIRNITQQTRARVDVHRKDNVGSVEKAITIYGQPENLTKACHQILKVMEEEAKNTGKSEEIPLKILAHNNLIGRIIGKNGATINKIMDETNTKITVSSIHDINSFNMERIISIRGSIDDISRAEAEVSGKLRSAYESDINSMAPQSVVFPGQHHMMSVGAVNPAPQRLAAHHYAPRNEQSYTPAVFPYANNATYLTASESETAYLYIPNSSVGAVIGTKGAYIRNVIKYSGASVKIAPVPDGESEPTERRVTIVGSPEGQWKAQYLIYESLRKEVTNPGLNDVRLTVEIKVPSSNVGRIIGKGGANVREMQRLTGAVIKFPEHGSGSGSEETSVQIIGQFYAVQSGQRRVRALIQSSANPGYHNSPHNGNQELTVE